MAKEKNNIILTEFMILVEKIIREEKAVKQYIEGVNISRSEVHMMAIVDSYENIHISGIARKFNVTKGAVSKTVRNLERKGLVEKHIDPGNHSRILISLTKKGLKITAIHEKIHNEMNENFMEYYKSLSKKDIDRIIIFLHKAQQMSERHL